MTIELMMFFGIGFLSCLALYFLYASIAAIINTINFYKKLKTFPSCVYMNEDNMCKGPHSYEKISLHMGQVAQGLQTVCKDCGYISGTEYQLNKPGIEALNQKIEAKNKLEVKAQKVRDLMHKKLDENFDRLKKEFTDIKAEDIEFIGAAYLAAQINAQEEAEAYLKQSED